MRSRFNTALILASFAATLGATAQTDTSLVEQALDTRDMSVRLFVDYRKGTLILRPNSDAPDVPSAAAGDDRTLAVFQPNAGPALGIGLKITPFLSAAFSRSVVPWQRDPARRGRSIITHYELHWYKRYVGADLYHQSYAGMFLDRIRADDLGLLGDALFKKSEHPARYPDLTLQNSGLNLFYNVAPDDFDAGAFMTQGNRPVASGWSLLAMFSYSTVAFGNPDPLVPTDLRKSYGERGGALSGGRIDALAILPGIGGAVVLGPPEDTCFASAVAFWGYSLQNFELYGSDVSGKARPAPTGNLRGSIGYTDTVWFASLMGYKSILTTDGEDLTVTTTTSLVELGLGRRL